MASQWSLPLSPPLFPRTPEPSPVPLKARDFLVGPSETARAVSCRGVPSPFDDSLLSMQEWNTEGSFVVTGWSDDQSLTRIMDREHLRTGLFTSESTFSDERSHLVEFGSYQYRPWLADE